MNVCWAGCVAALLAGNVFAEKSAEMPAAARQAITRMESSVLQAKKKAVSELTAVLNSETRAGRLESAVSVSAKIKELSAEVAVLEGGTTSKKGEDFIAGVWRGHNGVMFTLEKGNTFAASGGNFKWQGKWRVEDGKLIVDSALFLDSYDLPATKEARDGKAVWTLKGKNSKGEPVAMDKQD